MLAWLRLLVDPRDAPAVVRALARPPIELPSADIARCVQIARRRRIDMVAALAAATESPQLAPEARERISQFLRIHARRRASARRHARRPLRAPPDRAARPAPPAALHGPRRRRRAAAQPRAARRARRRLRAAACRGASAREFARYVAVLADAGLGEEEALGAPARARGRGDGARGRRRVSASTTSSCSACTPAAASACAPAGARARSPTSSRREPAPSRRRSERARRLLYVGDDARRAQRVVLAYAATLRARRPSARPSPLAEEARVALGARVGVARGGAVRARRGAPLDLPRAPRRAARRASRASARGWASCASTPTSTSPTASCATSSWSSSRR